MKHNEYKDHRNLHRDAILLYYISTGITNHCEFETTSQVDNERNEDQKTREGCNGMHQCMHAWVSEDTVSESYNALQ